MSSILSRLVLLLYWAGDISSAQTRNTQSNSAHGERVAIRTNISRGEKGESVSMHLQQERNEGKKKFPRGRLSIAGKITEEMMFGQIWKLGHVERPEEVGELSYSKEERQRNESWKENFPPHRYNWYFLHETQDLVRVKVQMWNINWARGTSP